jgi:hypothetical protein
MPKPFDVDDTTIPKSSPALSSPVKLGSGTTGSRPATVTSAGGYFDDTTVGKRVFWDGRKWRDMHGVES